MSDLNKLAKQCLGIVETATLKDDEINMLISSAKTDMKRVDIDVENNINDNLVINTIMLYVKAHFGDLTRYISNIRALKESEEYRIGDDSNA